MQTEATSPESEVATTRSISAAACWCFVAAGIVLSGLTLFDTNDSVRSFVFDALGADRSRRRGVRSGAQSAGSPCRLAAARRRNRAPRGGRPRLRRRCAERQRHRHRLPMGRPAVRTGLSVHRLRAAAAGSEALPARHHGRQRDRRTCGVGGDLAVGHHTGPHHIRGRHVRARRGGGLPDPRRHPGCRNRPRGVHPAPVDTGGLAALRRAHRDAHRRHVARPVDRGRHLHQRRRARHALAGRVLPPRGCRPAPVDAVALVHARHRPRPSGPGPDDRPGRGAVLCARRRHPRRRDQRRGRRTHRDGRRDRRAHRLANRPARLGDRPRP